MKKIMFNDKFLLTNAVKAGKKTMTRRIAHLSQHNADILMGKIPTCPQSLVDAIWLESRYKIGEVVAVAQRYKDIADGVLWDDCREFEGVEPTKLAGWNNKLFVRPDYMKQYIRITGIKLECLQDISDEDCLKEGVAITMENNRRRYVIRDDWHRTFATPQKAFAFLIDKVSGKGTWDSNPYVFAYEFELVD